MQIIHWFLKTYPELVNKMKNTDHHIDENTPAIYHAEGDVYTHTMCVYTHVQLESTELKLAALLHDIGKVSTKHIKENAISASFSYHENISMFEAIKILEQFEKDFPKEKIDKVKILKGINFHQFLHKITRIQDGEVILPEDQRQWLNHFFGSDLDFYEFMVKLGKADALGRIAEDIDRMLKKYEFLENFIPEEMYHQKDGKPIAYILSGPQGTGKSTWAKEMLKTNDFKYLSADDILTNGGTLAYNMVYTKQDAADADMKVFADLKEAVKNRHNIIVDGTNTDPQGRERKSKIIPDKYYHKVAVNFISSPEKLKERNNLRKKEGKDMPFEIIEGKMKQYQLAGTDLFHEAWTIIT